MQDSFEKMNVPADHPTVYILIGIVLIAFAIVFYQMGRSHQILIKKNETKN